ncbi:MAG TPA: hypothetical protein VF979_00040 [Streptosporangiaceae bacterium]
MDGDQRGRSQADLIRAFIKARDSGDFEQLERAALALPAGQRFGAEAGQLPALVHEAYRAAVTPASRCRLAGALAKVWAYSMEPERAVPFADEAVALARDLGQPEMLADALDVALLAVWGPDSFAQRLELSAQLAQAAGHVADPELRLTAHLWRLTTAWECLDVVAVQRQLRALDILAEESGSVRMAFFAAARRAMHALVTASLDRADELIARTSDIGRRSDEPDVAAVSHSLAAGRARRAGDTEVLRREAAEFAEYGASEGIASICAEAAVIWLAAGEPDRAADLAIQLAGAGLDAVPRNVDFLLTVASLTEVGSALKLTEIVTDGLRLLEPYAGRAVLNAGAVTFHGVIDDYLFRASQALDRPETDQWARHATLGYQRLGATWWKDRLGGPAPAPQASVRTTIQLRQDGSGWVIGGASLPDLKGLHYLRQLLGRPGQDVAAAQLAAAIGGHPAEILAEFSAGELIDRQALDAYRSRLRDLDEELAEAQDWADEARLSRLHEERVALLDQVAAATGLGGRQRRFSSADERARVAVRKAIAAALARVEQQDPATARLLKDTIRTGATCRYDPDPARPVTWLLD